MFEKTAPFFVKGLPEPSFFLPSLVCTLVKEIFWWISSTETMEAVKESALIGVRVASHHLNFSPNR
jgi:hypothetical protein